jgi:hypothetical protein
MLRSPIGAPQHLVLAEAEPGDKFYLVGTSTLTRAPVSVTILTVVRAGKRDIVCTDNSQGMEKRFKRDSRIWNAYLTREEVTWAIDAIRLNKKQLAAWRAIQDNKIETISEELADRIIAWGRALEEEKEAPRE